MADLSATGERRLPGYYPEPRERGAEGRARARPGEEAGTNRVEPTPPAYPPERVRVEEPDVPETHTAEKYQTLGPTALGDTLADFGSFNGRPDRIQLNATSFAAVVQLVDEMNRDGYNLVVPVAGNVVIPLSARKIQARNQTAGSVSTLTALGIWDEPRGTI